MELTEFEFEKLLKNSLAAEDVPSELLNARLKEKLNAKRPKKNIFVPMKTVAAAVVVIAVSAGVIVNSNEDSIKLFGENQIAYKIEETNNQDIAQEKTQSRNLQNSSKHTTGVNKTEDTSSHTKNTQTEKQDFEQKNTDIDVSEYITKPDTKIQLASEPMTRNIEEPINDNVSYNDQIGIAAFSHTDGELEGTEKPVTVDDDWGIALSVKDVSSEGLTVVYTHSDEDFTGELSTNSNYVIEAYSENETIPVEMAFAENDIEQNDEQNVILQNDTVETEVNWQKLYGSLPTGKYRLGKEITNRNESGECEKSTYYVDFEIE